MSKGKFTPRTTAPETGDRFERFKQRWDVECDSCGYSSLDHWMTVGATASCAVCPQCGHEHDHERVREKYRAQQELDR